FGATSFSQQMLRFEEFAVHPVPTGPTPAKVMPLPLGDATHTICQARPPAQAMDDFLAAPLWPAPSREANVGLPNQWASLVQPCVAGVAVGFTGVAEGRPPGVNYSHQRWDEFPPAVAFQTAQGQARPGTGRLDVDQSHDFAVGEFAPGGLYHNTAGVAATAGTNAGINIALHPGLPTQDPLSRWTFGDGTLPPKLLRARYAEPVLNRHYNALPLDVNSNSGPGVIGFGEHTITTHEHNGHQPGESDGFAGAYFFPGQFYDYRWPMVLAGYDSINTDASDPRASTPCSLGEKMMISDPITHLPVEKTCDPDTLTINIPGDWHEIMSTHWFHDHMIDRTSENVYKGNAAMMNYYSGIDRGKEGFKCNYDDPANNVNLCLPSGTDLDWGNRDYDIQILVADKAWAPVTGQLAMADQTFHQDGFLADRMTVNWLYKPYFDVRARKYRLRILDGSVARFFKIAIVREFDDQPGQQQGTFPGPINSNKSYSRIPYHMIANDGNILEHAVPFPNAQSNDLPVQCIAERHDVIVDFSQFPVGTKLHMVNTLHHDDGKGPGEIIPLADILSGAYVAIPDLTAGCTDRCWDNDPTIGKFLEFRVQQYTGTDLSMNPADYEVGKKTMIPLVKITAAELAAAKHRTFHFGRGGGEASDGRPTPWTIDVDGSGSLNANINRVSAAPETIGGGWEIWHVTSGGGWGHPIHIHFEEGQYLQRSDGPDPITGLSTARTPPLWEVGARKDMYRVSGLGEGPLGLPDSSLEIDVALRFREFAGTFVEHCHNTTHEDKAMLLRWDNELPGQTTRIPTPIPEWEGVTYVSPATPYTHASPADPDGTIQTAVVELPTIKSGVPSPLGFVMPNQLSADINQDGLVNIADLGIFKSQFLTTGNWGADFNENRLVNISDLGILKSQFLQTTGLPPANLNPLP
ncbi:MAG: multicopper oxidase domain-containing protein, partial [Gammaproteobacteria bacterium]|nr:multicopper oxidase domain-containing protein [Gammaproteobacteria bacterium]